MEADEASQARTDEVKVEQKRPSFLMLLPCFLLVLVATSRLAVSNSWDLSAWKGGGFGMFSTVDSPSNRQIVVKVEYVDGRVFVEVPRKLRRDAAFVRHTASEKAFNGLVDEIAKFQEYDTIDEPHGIAVGTVLSITVSLRKGEWDSSHKKMNWSILMERTMGMGEVFSRRLELDVE